jgi:membrane-bound metal-dependent hydrolase YbcI (DUF457 family)
MTGKSHLAAGTVLTAAALQQANYTPHSNIWFWFALGIGMVASLLPDTDSPNPMLKGKIKAGGQPKLAQLLFGYKARKRIPTNLVYGLIAAIELLIRHILAGLISIVPGLVKHRGPTHYLITAVGLTALFWLITNQLGSSTMYTLAFGVGYLSHIWCDTMTKSGVRLLAPFLPKKSFHSLPRPLRLTTGQDVALSEYIALATIGVGSALAFVFHPPIYIPAVAVAIAGMFITTALYDRLHPKKMVQRSN